MDIVDVITHDVEAFRSTSQLPTLKVSADVWLISDSDIYTTCLDFSNIPVWAETFSALYTCTYVIYTSLSAKSVLAPKSFDEGKYARIMSPPTKKHNTANIKCVELVSTSPPQPKVRENVSVVFFRQHISASTRLSEIR